MTVVGFDMKITRQIILDCSIVAQSTFHNPHSKVITFLCKLNIKWYWISDTMLGMSSIQYNMISTRKWWHKKIIESKADSEFKSKVLEIFHERTLLGSLAPCLPIKDPTKIFVRSGLTTFFDYLNPFNP